MRFKVSAEGAVNFVRRSVYPVFTWPLPATATDCQKNIFTVLWYLMILNLLCSLFPVVYSIYVCRDNLFIVSTSTCYATAICGALSRIFIFKIRKKRIQSLILEMESFLKISQPREQKILDSYVRRYSGFHCTAIITSYVAGVFVICAPLFVPIQKFPTSAVYPFSTDSGTIYYIVYLLQVIGCVQAAAAANTDSQTALLLWFVSSRLEMLAEELQRICNDSELIIIVKKHNHLLRLAEDATNVMSYVAFTIAMCGYSIVAASCLILVDKYPLAVKMQILPMALIGIVWMFFCAWPADNLINACSIVGTAAYNSAWPDMSPKLRKNLLIILQRSQRPVVASIRGFIPALSLNYYGCFVSTALSYFMAVRAMVNKT